MLTDMVSSRNQKERSKKPSIQKRGCVISPNNGSKVGLKAQKLLAQGIALGNVDKKVALFYSKCASFERIF